MFSRKFLMLRAVFSFKKFQIAVILFLVIVTLRIVIDLEYLSKQNIIHQKRGKHLIGKFSTFGNLKADVFFNGIVLESENVGQETELVSDKISYLLEKGDKDLNAAFENLSPQEDGKEEILSLNKINQALTSSNKSFKQSASYLKLKKNSQITNSVQNFVWTKSELEKSRYWNFRNFSSSEIASLSVLGRRLFLHENIGQPANQKFLIYIYKFGKRLERRFIYQYGKKRKDPLENCSVKNCIFSYEESDLPKADCVFFHLHLIQGPPTHLVRKNFNQRWVWLSDESIFHTFSVAKDKNLDNYSMFNWSMSYRSDSDVPVPYGRTIPLLQKPLPNSIDEIFDKKPKTAAFMSSNCQTKNQRLKYVKNLEKYLEIDTYGRCGEKKCSQHFNTDCLLLDQYKFYLAFENANCKEYITEKAWWNAFAKKSVPVVMGCPKVYYVKHFPPNSFIHVDDFSSSKELAHYLRFLSQDKEAYNKYHEWRNRFEVVNEHGYFQTNVFHYCRLCEALNYNDPSPKTSNMKQFWNISRDCNTVSYTN